MTQIYLSKNEISASQMMKAVNNQFGGNLRPRRMY
uniref:HTH_48 domain-containing protein n=1 Tax=Strongyloides venezuelensis TaxID=75913 RepID=A0A0K0FWM3_STRVS